ncbi:helix-turn-helix domain-containing protein [Paeniglutamicibacter psychrophenolicus]|uniref:helix-turn-helix domain-containing protein n=1 Tax=Paeniglutamicibacter psychrophenolicus TaxID=257454 RepID=UPI00278050BC|nr:helix-turn-helix transcriptional regulator [Paeniglutamicibacter psychrophenolicus]MDQ0094687.1 transcriptional regulator with XRE-family HTH domain [Paeniglutamicibacter psychrophenolicus]
MGDLGNTAAAAGASERSGAEILGGLLREELEAAGMPTYQTIANRGGISKSAVSDAMRGLRIPSARTVLGIMTGLDRDPELMMSERERLLRLDATDERAPVGSADQDPAQQQGIPEPNHVSGVAVGHAHDHAVDTSRGGAHIQARNLVDGPIPAVVHSRPHRTPFGKMAFVLACVLFAGIVAGHFATATLAAGDSGDIRAATTGSNVLDMPCTKDGIVVASENRARDTRMEIVFSHDCQALWGRVLRNDGRAFGNGMEAVFYPKGDPRSELAQRVEVQDSATALTAMVNVAEKTRQFCVEATLTVDGGRVDLGDPLCL